MKAAIEILGLPEMPVENISFDSITITAAKGILCSDAKMIDFKDVAVHPSSGPLLSVMDCEGITADRMEVFEGVSPLIYADGLNTKDILLTHTNTANSKVPVLFGAHISHEAVILR